MVGRSASLDLKARIPVLRHVHGMGIKTISDILGVKKTLVYKTLQYHKVFGVCYNINAVKGHRRRLLSHNDLAYIRNLIRYNSTIYLDEIQGKLSRARGVNVSIATLSRSLRRMRYTQKRISARALERDETLRAAFMNYIGTIVDDPEMLMFTDESSKDERTVVRRSGWSEEGIPCVSRKCFVRGQRFSILPVMSLDGIIAHDVVEGSVTGERFVEFLREMVVRCPTTSHFPLLNALTRLQI